MKKNFRDLILNLIIAVLTLTMLVLMLMYAAQRAAGHQNDTEVFEKLWIVQDYDGTAFTVFDSSLCTPELIAYKQSGMPAGVIHSDEELMSTLYSVLSDVILDVFGSESMCISENIDYETAVSMLTIADSYLMLEYSADIPFPYIYALTSGESSVDTQMCASGKAVYISKLALLLSEDENKNIIYSALAFDSDHGAYSFERTDSKPYTLPSSDVVHLDAYSSSFEKAEFYSDKHGASAPSTELIYSSASYSPLQASSGMEFLGLDNDLTRAAFLELFELNPEKLNSFVERDGTTVFIGTDERLTVSPDNTVEFSSPAEPIPLNKILGYTPSKKSSYSLFDMLKATDMLISRFRTAYPEHIGKSASIKLTGVYKDEASGGNPVFEYSYFYDGMRIDAPSAFRFVFTADGICKLTLNTTGFTVMSEKRVTLSKETALERLSLKLSGEIKVRPIYILSDERIYSLEWAAYNFEDKDQAR
ncbi:MAG: hypothetical protein IJ391_05890 [Clostridia bacterium]|nr:hypothetical protein [Clostridia bacterium]